MVLKYAYLLVFIATKLLHWIKISRYLRPQYYYLFWFAFPTMEMEMKTITRNPEDETIKTLYNASLNSSVTVLNTLLQDNPLILHKVSLSLYNETPLHISSLLGHLEFCEILLKNKPSFTNQVDSKGRCPLHLASAEGHTQVVKALLLANQHVCLVSDKDDMIPLHFAVIRGRMGVIKELINARPDSIRIVNEDGSVLHLCVLYNHLESLKFLLEFVRGDKQLLLAIDREGNTILHLAIRLKQIKVLLRFSYTSNFPILILILISYT